MSFFRYFLTCLMILLSCNITNAQIYKFQQYDARKGLRNQFVNSTTQDKHGFVWFATGLGLCRYDGLHFFSPDEDVAPPGNITTTFRDERGFLWFGYDDGMTVRYDGVDFSVADTSISKTAVKQIIQAPRGEILVATQTGGITRINRGKKIDRLTEGFEEIMISALCFVGNDRLLVGSLNGLSLYSYDSEQLTMALIAEDENLSYNPVIAIKEKNNGSGYWIATEYGGIFHVTIDENRFSTSHINIPELEEAQVQSVFENTQNELWIPTFGAGLLRVQLSDDMSIVKTTVYNANNGLGSDYVKHVFFDNQQNIWVATSGQGVTCITNPTFSVFETLTPIGNNATAVFSGNDSEYWFAGIGAIIRITTQPASQTVWGRNEKVPNDKITVLRGDDAGNLWIGTQKSGLYKLAKNAKTVSQSYQGESLASNDIRSLVLDDGKIWLATREGILIIDQKTEKMIDHLTTTDGLPHNYILDIFKDSKNNIWYATRSNSIIDIKNGQRLTLPDMIETEFSAIAEDEQGRLWAATRGRGVFLFERDTVYHFTTEDDLITDHCYAMASDGKGRIWVGHRGGFSSINTNRLTVNVFGIDNNIYGDVNDLAIVLTKSGELLIGMTDGVMMYDTKIELPQEITPMLNLAQVLIKDQLYNPYLPLVLPYGKWRVQFDFVGLQYSNPKSVYYQYRLEGYDTEWTPFSKNTTAPYQRLENGNYSFWVKACNSDNCTEPTMLFSLTIRKPFWLSWWFVLLTVATIIGLGYTVIAVRERNHKRQQEYLENELKARTKEVHRQKEEIEIKNKDITDSINYAQRIQFSVLPSTSTLMEHCSDAFIFYRPRDIVSGDFYWFDYFPDSHRLLIVCADATGHGVPGAFMSLIGTTLIKDIAIRPDVRTPSDILYRLDENIQSTLNQNRDSEQANDGMDIIVCEINTKTYLTKIASAMRPYIIYHEGVSEICKSSRASIGGQRLENKLFETNEIQLSKGDTIYMFTDGYADQFGGPAGKKLKMNRLQNILDDIYTRDMNEQLRVIKENFDLWKGPMLQVDDILMIGVRL